MKVAMLHKDFEPLRGGGGTARHIHGLATALSQLGCEVRVIAPRPERFGSPYTTYDLNGDIALREHIVWADVVHVHGARSTLALRGARLSRALDTPFFYTPHCWYGPRSFPNAVAKKIWDQIGERYLLAKCAATIVLTPFWQEYLAAHRLPYHKTVVIPNCVLKTDVIDDRRRCLHPFSSGSKYLQILSVGRLSPEKRGADLIRALAEPVLSAARLTIVGKGPDQNNLEDLATELGVIDRVEFRGFVPDDELAGLISNSDVFVLASEEEGLPTILLEMIFSRLPIVCTKIPGNLAITEPLGIASTYEVGDYETLASLIANYDATSISDHVVETAETQFVWEKRAVDILNLYKRK